MKFFLFFNEHICCYLSLEPSHRDGSNEGSQSMICVQKWKIIPMVSLLPILTILYSALGHTIYTQMRSWSSMIMMFAERNTISPDKGTCPK